MTLDLAASLPPAPAEAPEPAPLKIPPAPARDELADKVTAVLTDMVTARGGREFASGWDRHLASLADELVRLARQSASSGDPLNQRDLEHIRDVSYMISARITLGESNRFSRDLTEASTAVVRLLRLLISKAAL